MFDLLVAMWPLACALVLAVNIYGLVLACLRPNKNAHRIAYLSASSVVSFCLFILTLANMVLNTIK